MIFCQLSFDDLIDPHNLWGCGTFFLKAIQIFPKNLLDFRLDMSETQNIINLSSNSNKVYESIILTDSEEAFLGERENAAFRSLLYFILFICNVSESN